MTVVVRSLQHFIILRYFDQDPDIQLGNFRVNSKADIPEALEALKDRPLYAEKWAYFKMVRKYIPFIRALYPIYPI